jgi:hypothetical protein
MSVLDDYLVDPNVSLLSKTLIRGVGPRIGAANYNQASLLVKVKSASRQDRPGADRPDLARVFYGAVCATASRSNSSLRMRPAPMPYTPR